VARLNVAFVGAGVIAARYAEAVAAVESLAFVGATDLVDGRAEKLGGAVYATLDELLADDRVELVVNLTAPASHAAVTRAALAAGKHVHTEKPVALRAAEAWELAALARANGIRLSCAPATLLGEAQQTAWKLVRDGAIGPVRVVYAEANWGPIERWHPSPEMLYEAGPLVDVGIYPLTIVTAMFGPVRTVSAYASTIQQLRRRKDGIAFELVVPDFWVATLEHDSGVVTRLTASFWVSPSKQRGLEFHGDAGSLWMPTWAEFDSRLQRTTDGEDYEDVPLVREPYHGIGWARALVDLVEAVTEDRPHRASAEHAAHVVDVLNAAEASWREGRPGSVTSSFEPPAPLEWAR
jgi:predicted dehydrogenase